MKSGQDKPQLTHVTFPNSHMTIYDYKALPNSVKCVVAVMHTNQHYAVMEITIAPKPSRSLMDYINLSLIGKTP
jgi:hypothetical protein